MSISGKKLLRLSLNNISSKLSDKTNLRNGMFFTFFSFLNNGISFVITLIMGRYIMPNSYGKLSMFTTMVSFLSIFICLGTNGFYGVEYFKSTKDRLCRLINVTILSTLLVYIIFILVIIIFSSKLDRLLGIEFQFQIYAITICLLQIFQFILMDIWRLEEKVIKYGILTTVSVLLNLVLTSVFVMGLLWDWEGRVYAQIISGALVGIISVYILIKKKYIKAITPRREDYTESLKFGVPLIPHSMSFWLRQGVDRYAINYFITQAAVGLYSFAYNFANIINMVGTAFNSSYSVAIYKILSTEQINKIVVIKKECKIQLFLYSVITLLIFIGAYIFVPVIFPKYKDSIIYLFPLCIGALLQCCYLTFVNIIFFYKKSKKLMYITFLTSLLHVAMTFWVTRYGVIYTSYVIVVSNGIIATLVTLYSKRLLRQYC